MCLATVLKATNFNNIHELSGLRVHEWCCVVMVGVLSSTRTSCVCVCVCVCVLTQLTQFKLSHGHLLASALYTKPLISSYMCRCTYTILWYAKYTLIHSSPPPTAPPGRPENLAFPSIRPYSVTVTWDPPTDDGGTPTVRQFYSKLLMVGLFSGDDRSIGGQREVDSGVGYLVGLELCQIHVQSTVKAKRSSDGRDNL